MTDPTSAILIVDDDEDIRNLLQDRLEFSGYRVRTAGNGVEGMECIRAEPPDLVLLDIRMPEMDGFGVLKRLAEEGLETTVVMITAHGTIQTAVQAMQEGAFDFLVKPFHPNDVERKIERAIERTRLRRENLRLQRELEEARAQRTRELEEKNRELEAANRQIREATERKSKFLASMSHELRTPMNAIVGFTGLVLRKCADSLPERHRENLEKVKLSADYLLDLINDILDLSRIEAGRMDVHPALFAVRKLLAECCATLSPLIRPDVRLHSEVSEAVGQAHTDEAKLRQIVINLLSNARKFTDRGEIGVRAAVEGASNDRLVVSVSDTGTGIPPEAIESIFEEFTQVQGSDTEYKGTGLGLSITRKLTELLGGTVSVESELGKGSTFTVRIPTVYKAS